MKIFVLLAFALLSTSAASAAGVSSASRVEAGLGDGDPLRVGVLVSHAHVTGPHWTSKPYETWRATAMIEAMSREDIALHAVVEPGTACEPILEELLAHPRFAGRLIDGSNADGLAGLDVLVIPDTANAEAAVTGAILVAQGSGLHLLIHSWYGVVTPTYADPFINRLHGIKQGAYFWNREEKPVVVVKSHPILEGLVPGDTLSLKPNGVGGNLGAAEVLLEVAPEDARGFGPGPTEGSEPGTQAVVFLSRVGKGQVLALNWHNKERPKELSDEFYANAARWLAGRALVGIREHMHEISSEAPVELPEVEVGVE